MNVFVNGKKVSIYRGMCVKHALIAFDQDAYEEALSGNILVEDENGFLLGLEGALLEGARLYLKPRIRNIEHGLLS
ncbi:MAG: hypothetical protein ABFD97_04155 [Syntrophobacter sp.]